MSEQTKEFLRPKPAGLQGEAGVHLAEGVALAVDGADGHGPVVRAVASKLWDVAGNLKAKKYVS